MKLTAQSQYYGLTHLLELDYAQYSTEMTHFHGPDWTVNTWLAYHHEADCAELILWINTPSWTWLRKSKVLNDTSSWTRLNSKYVTDAPSWSWLRKVYIWISIPWLRTVTSEWLTFMNSTLLSRGLSNLKRSRKFSSIGKSWASCTKQRMTLKVVLFFWARERKKIECWWFGFLV